MYVVIFTAEIADLNREYFNLAAKLRQRAIDNYGCAEFISTTQDNQEITLSYWPDLTSIQRWKADELHIRGQELGKSQFYKGYRVDICEVVRHYQGASQEP